MISTIPPTIDLDSAASIAWDAVVIGAGPAGSCAAAALARAGRSTLLLDRTALPRDKVCGCCIGPDGAAALIRASLGDVLRGAGEARSLRLQVARASARLAAADHYVLDRATLDARLAVAARAAGASLLWPASASILPDGSVRAIAGAREAPIRAASVVVADGLGGSSLRSCGRFLWRTARSSRIGAGATIGASDAAVAQGEIRLLCSGTGYVGLVRLPSGHVHVAAAIDPDWMRAVGGPGEAAAAIASSCHAEGDEIAPLLREARWRGAPTLTRRRVPVASGSIYLAGDSAGYVEPFTGEGMSWAIESGLALGRLLAERAPSEMNAARAWIAQRRVLLDSRSRRCAIIAWALRRPALVQAVCRGAARSPTMASVGASLIGFRAGMHAA